MFELTEAIVGEHDVIVFTDGSREELLRWNTFCRSRTVVVGNVRGEDQVVPRPIKFIAAGVKGATGYLFSDFGPGFQCIDHDGEPPVVRHVRHITNDKEVRLPVRSHVRFTRALQRLSLSASFVLTASLACCLSVVRVLCRY